MNADTYQAVHDRYSAIARNSASADEAANAKIATKVGYTAAELQTASGANLGLSCGAPIAQAKLQQGEVVVDLGSGGGLDVFLAAKAVGPEGKAIGVDMSEDMLAVANRNATKKGTTNTSFVKSRLPNIALPPSNADCIVSNCVINLIPQDEKPEVFKEMFRILQPGGRVVLSDILARKPLSEEMKSDIALYVGCIAGASQAQEYDVWLREAGFQDVAIVDSGLDLNIFKDYVTVSGAEKDGCHCCDACETRESDDAPCECHTKLDDKAQAEEGAAASAACCGSSDLAEAETTAPCCGPQKAAFVSFPAPQRAETAPCCAPRKEAPDTCCGPRKEAPDTCCGPQREEAAPCCAPGKTSGSSAVKNKSSLPDNVNEWVGSFTVFARKPMA